MTAKEQVLALKPKAIVDYYETARNSYFIRDDYQGDRLSGVFSTARAAWEDARRRLVVPAQLLRTKISTASCEMYVFGLDMDCPLCQATVRSGTRHHCGIGKEVKA